MYYFKRYKTYKNKKINKIVLIVIVVIALLLGLFLYIDIKLKPILISASTSSAREIATMSINTAIGEKINDLGISYADIVTMKYDNNGNITSVSTNAILLNEMKSQLSIAVNEKIENIKNMQLNIPIGNLIDGEIFTGRGPKVNIKLFPVGSVLTDIENSFKSAGINQTMHQIIMKVTVKIGIIFPAGTSYTEVVSSVVLAETVIVGKVPDYYTNIGSLGVLTKDEADLYNPKG